MNVTLIVTQLKIAMIVCSVALSADQKRNLFNVWDRFKEKHLARGEVKVHRKTSLSILLGVDDK